MAGIFKGIVERPTTLFKTQGRVKFLEIAIYSGLFFVILLSVRDFLFGAGFASAVSYGFYSSENTLHFLPLSFNIYFGFDSIATSLFYFPFTVPFMLGLSPIIAAKISTLIVFSTYYLLALVESRLAYKAFGGQSDKMGIVFSVIFVLMMFLNLVTIFDIGSDLLPFLFGTPLLLYVFLKVYTMMSKTTFAMVDVAKTSLAISLATMGDPRYYVWWVIIAFFVTAATVVKKRDFLRSLKIVFFQLCFTIPTLAFVYATTLFETQSSVYSSPRILNNGSLAFFSSVTHPTEILMFLGSWWPSPISAPPSLLFYPRQSILHMRVIGDPAIMVLPGGFVQELWLISLFFVTALSFCPLLISRRERTLLYFYPTYLVFIAITMGSWFPIQTFIDAYISIGYFPIIGGIWEITFAIPNFFNQVTIVFAILFSSYFLFKILHHLQKMTIATGLSQSTFRSNRFGFKSRGVLIIFTFFVITVLVFSGWQFFDGSFYPSNYDSQLGGNGVPPVGSYSPITPPSAWLHAYDFISRHDNGSYAVAWGLPGTYSPYWAKELVPLQSPGVNPNPNFYVMLSKLVSLRRYDLTQPLMNAFGVRYFVVDNTSMPPQGSQVLFQFFKNSPGISIAFGNSPYLCVFADKDASLFSQAVPHVLEYNGTALDTLSIDGYFNTLLNSTPPIYPRYVQNGVRLSLNVPHVTDESILLMDPQGLVQDYRALGFPSNVSEEYLPAGSTNAPIGNGWKTTAFTVGEMINVTNGILNMTTMNSNYAPQGGVIVLGYLTSLIPNSVAIDVPEYNTTTTIVNWSFQYETPSNTTAVSTSAASNNYLLQSNYSTTYPLKPSMTWDKANFTAELPPGARSFTILLNANINGTIGIKNMSITYSFLKTQQVQSLVKDIHFGSGQYKVVIYAIGNGTISLGGTSLVFENQHQFMIQTSISTNVSRNLVLNATNVSFSSMIVIPSGFYGDFVNLNSLSTSFVNFNPYSATVHLRGVGGYIALSVYPWTVSNGKVIGENSLGQLIILLEGNSNHYLFIKNAESVNVLISIFSIYFLSQAILIFSGDIRRTFQAILRNFWPS